MTLSFRIVTPLRARSQEELYDEKEWEKPKEGFIDGGYVEIVGADGSSIATSYAGSSRALMESLCYIVNTHDKLLAACKKILASRCEMDAIVAAVVADQLEKLE